MKIGNIFSAAELEVFASLLLFFFLFMYISAVKKSLPLWAPALFNASIYLLIGIIFYKHFVGYWFLCFITGFAVYSSMVVFASSKLISANVKNNRSEKQRY